MRNLDQIIADAMAAARPDPVREHRRPSAEEVAAKAERMVELGYLPYSRSSFTALATYLAGPMRDGMGSRDGLSHGSWSRPTAG